MPNIYEKNGYKNRAEYLESVAADYGVDDYVVECLADILGESEDFDGLISAVEDYEMFF